MPLRSDQYKPGMKLYESTFSYRDYFICKLKTMQKKRALKHFYQSIAEDELSNLPAGKKYLYVALQYQPEKSTCPLAGRFVDQRYLIQWLSSHLDDSWHLLVKEHPSQFIMSHTRFGECLRNERYYQDILETPKVTLLSLTLDSFSIMEKVEAVASAGGTVCWEGIARGIPAINFAACWFRPCHGVLNVSSELELNDAITKIDSGFKPELYLVKAFFAQLIHQFNFKAAVGGRSNLIHKKLDEEANAQAHFEAIKRLLK